MTWSKSIEQQSPDLCIECNEDTSFGSGRFVNRIPADDQYMCAECQMIDCNRCNNKVLDYEVTLDGQWICEECIPHLNPEDFARYQDEK
jgi:hypothetical protein